MADSESTPRIRLAGLDDIEIIRDLADRTWRVSYPDIISEAQIDYMLDWMYAAEQIRKEIESGGVRYLLAEIDDTEPAAFAAFGPDDSGGESSAFLHKLYVLPERQRLGLGSALLREVEQRALSEDFTKLSLRVNRGNDNAVRAYKRNGFRQVRELREDIGGGFVMDDFVMTKDLES